MPSVPVLKEAYDQGILKGTLKGAVKGLKDFATGVYGAKKEKSKVTKPENITGSRG